MTIGDELPSTAQSTGGNRIAHEKHGDDESSGRYDTASARGDASKLEKDDPEDELQEQDDALGASGDLDDGDLAGHAALLKAIRENKAEEQRLMRKAFAMNKAAHEPLIKLIPKIAAAFPGLTDFIIESAKTMTPKNKAALSFYVGYVLKARVGKPNGKAN